MLSAVRQGRALHGVLALAFLAAACQQPDAGNAPKGEADEYFDPTDLQQGVSFSCGSAAICSGSGTIYSSTYRLGATATSSGHLGQYFNANSTLPVASVELAIRKLRAYSGGNTASAKIRANIYAVTPGNRLGTDGVEFTENGVAGSPIVQLSANLSAITGPTIELTVDGATGSLPAGTYFMDIFTDDFDGSSGSFLFGVGAIASSNPVWTPVGAAGTPARVALRGSPGSWSPSTFRAAGAWPVAFGLSFSGGHIGNPCNNDLDCADAPSACREDASAVKHCVDNVRVSTAAGSYAPLNGSTATSTIAQLKVTFTGNVDKASVTPANLIVTGPNGFAPSYTVDWGGAGDWDDVKTATITLAEQMPYDAAIAVQITPSVVTKYSAPGGALPFKNESLNSPLVDGSNFKWSFQTREQGNRDPWKGSISAGAGWSQGTNGSVTYKLFSNTAEVQPVGRGTGGAGANAKTGYAGFIGSTHLDPCNNTGSNRPTWCPPL